MRSTVAMLLAVPAAVATLLVGLHFVSTPPSDPLIAHATAPDAKTGPPDNGWKSIRNDDGERIRWHSCTVTYAIDLNGYPATKGEPVEQAITDTEEASGVDFQAVPWDDADLQIQLTHVTDGNVVARTYPIRLDDTNISAEIMGYPKSRSYPEYLQVDIYRHELGHALGLAHIYGKDTMSSVVRPHPTQDGWRDGLGWLYQDCG